MRRWFWHHVNFGIFHNFLRIYVWYNCSDSNLESSESRIQGAFNGFILDYCETVWIYSQSPYWWCSHWRCMYRLVFMEWIIWATSTSTRILSLEGVMWRCRILLALWWRQNVFRYHVGPWVLFKTFFLLQKPEIIIFSRHFYDIFSNNHQGYQHNLLSVGSLLLYPCSYWW